MSIAVLACLLLGWIAPGDAAPRVAAAVSLQAPLQRFVEADPRHAASLAFASSGRLAAQARYGAPLDVLVSAAPEHVDRLIADGRLDPASRRVVARNRLVLVAPPRSPVRSIDDLRDGRRVCIGQPDVAPVGRYALQAMQRLGLTEAGPRLVHAASAAQVLAYVRSGDVDAAFVYASDVAGAADLRVVAEIAVDLHDPIEYVAAVVTGSDRAEAARRWIERLASPTGQRTLAAFGFLPASPTDAPATTQASP